MEDIGSFIQEARDKGLSDDKIRSALMARGWDTAVIDASLLGIAVPQPTAGTPTSTSVSAAKRPSISHLLAALHHVLLWFFTASSTVTIISVVTSLSGYRVSSQVLASMIAVTLITFTPYAFLFLLFLLKAARTPGLVPGKVWSIITICLHSVGAMIAAITTVVTLIVSGRSDVLLSAILVLVLNLIVVTTYCVAAFAPVQLKRLRRIVTIAHLPVLLLLFGALFILSVLQLGPAKHDEQLRKDLVQTVQKVNAYALMHKKLPAQASDATTSPDITYNKKDDANYEVCATFQTSNMNDVYGDYGSAVRPRDDSYVSESDFYASGTGRHCFAFLSSPVNIQEDWNY